MAGGRALDRGRHHVSGLAALGVPEDSLRSFPEAFRVGMAARADELRDPAQRSRDWEPEFGKRGPSTSASASSATPNTWRRTMDTARQHYEGVAGLTVLMTQDFGAQPGDLNPLGYQDSIGQPAIEGSGVEPLPGQGRRSRPASSSWATRRGRRAAAGPQPDVLGATARTWAAQVPVAGRGVQPLPAGPGRTRGAELLAAKLVGRGAAARR